LAVADYVLYTTDHPSPDNVWAEVKRSLPMLSRGTVYNTLNLVTEKGQRGPSETAADAHSAACSRNIS
jgi:Fe2+ or Zn2+ uptake regulation protein